MAGVKKQLGVHALSRMLRGRENEPIVDYGTSTFQPGSIFLYLIYSLIILFTWFLAMCLVLLFHFVIDFLIEFLPINIIGTIGHCLVTTEYSAHQKWVSTVKLPKKLLGFIFIQIVLNFSAHLT